MCITFLFTDSDLSHNYKLILINNRDEFYARKTLKAKVKVDEDGLIQIYGTDIEAPIHGTWLAVSKKNNVIKIGNLLNLPGEKVTVSKELLKGRGPIALDFVRGSDSIEVHNKNLCDVCTNYNSFNFLSVEITESDIKSIFTNNATKDLKILNAGDVVGISNSPIDSPLKKVEAGKEKFRKIIQDYGNKNKDVLIDELMNLLQCKERYYPDEELVRRRGQDAELFSSIHVRGHDLYGSRTRSVILVDKFNNLDYVEETIANDDPKNPIWERTRYIIEDNEVTQFL